RGDGLTRRPRPCHTPRRDAGDVGEAIAGLLATIRSDTHATYRRAWRLRRRATRLPRPLLSRLTRPPLRPTPRHATPPGPTGSRRPPARGASARNPRATTRESPPSDARPHRGAVSASGCGCRSPPGNHRVRSPPLGPAGD